MKFNSRHPIVAMPMNGVSDINLAIVVSQAGAVPSISFFNYYTDGKVNLPWVEKELKRFIDATSSTEIILSMHWEHFISNAVTDILLKNKIRLVELFIRPLTHQLWPDLSKQINTMKSHGVNVMFKTTGLLPVSHFDSIVLKGPQAAGRSFGGIMSLEEQYKSVKEKIGSKVIPSGGIGSPEQIKYFIKNDSPLLCIKRI
jgi:NAD(P)H-dependent flavin oxidoreductase YrpB (nitropropane dioxygenase family)